MDNKRLFAVILLGLVLVANTALAYVISANKIPLTNPPRVLEKKGNIYYYPSGTATFVTQSSQPEYYYFIVDNVPRACFTLEQPAFAELNTVNIVVDIGGTKIPVHCYDADPNYFSFQ